MKTCKELGLKRRVLPEYNYNASWYNLKTIRFGSGVAKELPPDRAEFYDVGINTKCNAECPFCYVSASHNGENFEGICDTWNKWMATYPADEQIGKTGKAIKTLKPFQIATGSTGEPTIHPEFVDFLKTVYDSGVIPNYTTNGISLCFDRKLTAEHDLAVKILNATEKYCGGVAVSFGNPVLQHYAKQAVENLMGIDININIHHIISDVQSVQRFLDVWDEYGEAIKYHVLLPLMPSGRSTKGLEPEAWKLLEKTINNLGIKNIAFGAHFAENLKDSSIKTWLYPPESLSKNVILQKNKVIITPSSFNLEPIKVIDL